MTKFYLLAVGILLLIACGPEDGETVSNSPASSPITSAGRNVPLEQYDRATISIKEIKFDAYVADERAERSDGLMFVKEGELAENEGMVFVFSTSEQLSFWMENTLIPLDIAYADEAGKILNIRQMEPLDKSPQPSEGPARYAVEMAQGWFAKNGIKKGDKFDFSNLSK